MIDLFEEVLSIFLAHFHNNKGIEKVNEHWVTSAFKLLRIKQITNYNWAITSSQTKLVNNNSNYQICKYLSVGELSQLTCSKHIRENIETYQQDKVQLHIVHQYVHNVYINK